MTLETQTPQPHGDIQQTYWYLEATPELMASTAAAAEALIGRSV